MLGIERVDRELLEHDVGVWWTPSHPGRLSSNRHRRQVEFLKHSDGSLDPVRSADNSIAAYATSQHKSRTVTGNHQRSDYHAGFAGSEAVVAMGAAAAARRLRAIGYTLRQSRATSQTVDNAEQHASSNSPRSDRVASPNKDGSRCTPQAAAAHNGN